MKYQFVDKNFLIPELREFYFKEDALNFLYRTTVNRNQSYNNNVYLVETINDIYNGYYYNDNDVLKIKDNSGKISIIPFNDSTTIINIQGITLKNNFIFYVQNKSDNSKICEKQENMELVIHESKKTNIKLEEIPKELEIKELSEEEKINKKKEEALLKMCEEVMEAYQAESQKIKKIENNLKSLDTKIKKLERKKYEEKINKITVTQCEYRAWKKMKYNIEENDDINKEYEELSIRDEENIIPIMFLSKYQYIDNLVKNNEIRNIFEYINRMNLEEIFTSDDYIIDENIIKISEKYVSYSKKLHYKFEHEWDYLENELNVNSTNSL